MTHLMDILVIAGSILTGILLMIPLYAIRAWHLQKIAAIKANQQVSIAEETRSAINQLRQEVAALRDTTTQYDLSFDSAMHRMESRIGHIENGSKTISREDQPVHISQL